MHNHIVYTGLIVSVAGIVRYQHFVIKYCWFHFMHNILMLIDVQANYSCMALSYDCNDKYYGCICGPIESLCCSSTDHNATPKSNTKMQVASSNTDQVEFG